MDEDHEEYYKERWVQRWATIISVSFIPAMLWIFSVILQSMHLRFEDVLEFPRFSDEGDKIDSEFTVAGWYAIIITLMMSRRLYRICKTWGWKSHHLDREATLMWNTWFVGLTVGTVFIYAFEAVLPTYMPGRGLVFPAIVITVACICYRVYEAILRAPKKK